MQQWILESLVCILGVMFILWRSAISRDASVLAEFWILTNRIGQQG
jgi:hypothetical protein